MNRRDFMQRSAVAGAALTFPKLPDFLADKRMGIVVHSYGIRWGSKIASTAYPAFTNAIELLEHCAKIGAGGAQVLVNDWAADFAKKVRDRREQLGLYLEGSIGMPKTESEVARFEKSLINAKEAGVNVLRTVCSAGRRYETYHSVAAFEALKKNAMQTLQWVEPVLRKHQVRLGIENHKDWRAPELAAMLRQIGSEWVGATVDFGNSIALLENPMDVVKALAPYAVSTHVKDMALENYTDGFLLSEVPLGKGLCNLPEMVALCTKHNTAVRFSLEMITRDPLEIPCLKDAYWETFPTLPAPDLAQTLRLVNEHPYPNGLPRISPLNPEQKLAAEENNILECLTYSREKLGMKH